MKTRSLLLLPLTLLTCIGMGLPAMAGTVCQVADPTGTPLNVRAAPKGRIINALRNGREVEILKTSYDRQGNPWAKVGGYYRGQYRVWGWVFQDYLNCDNP